MPPDLVPVVRFGIPQRGYWELRSIILPDAAALVFAAQQDGIDLWVASGYRSYQVQANTHRYWVQLRGEEAADRISAQAGHSQHQLGTAIDFNLGGSFGPTSTGPTSPAGVWLWDHAHEFGFVFPYTPASIARSGYIFEPWHVRWVGRFLAQAMWQAGYQYSEDFTADDVVAAARKSVQNSSTDCPQT